MIVRKRNLPRLYEVYQDTYSINIYRVFKILDITSGTISSYVDNRNSLYKLFLLSKYEGLILEVMLCIFETPCILIGL
jgi:hypothetical protein